MFSHSHTGYPYPYIPHHYPFPYPPQPPYPQPHPSSINQHPPKIEDYSLYQRQFPFFALEDPNIPPNSQFFCEKIVSPKKVDELEEEQIKIKSEEIEQIQGQNVVPEEKIIYKQKTKRQEKNKKKPKQDNEDLYEPEIVQQKQVNALYPYPKKNTQSNIVNQIFSYVSSPNKSMEKLMKIFNNKSKVVFYYELIKCVKKGKKKYINRQYLINLTQIDESHPGYKLFKRGKGSRSTITLQEFRMAVNKLIWIYLDIECVITITTSKKLAIETWGEHLERRREIQKFFLQKDKTKN